MPKNVNQPIIVNNPQKGIAPSSYLGFEEIRNLNITDKPGVCYPHRALVKESAATVVDLLEKMIVDSAGDIWGYGTEVGNDVFKRDSGTWEIHVGGAANKHTDSGIYGIFFWKGYVGVIIGGTIDWYDISDDTSENGWGASDITNSASGKTIALHSAHDDYIYLGAGRVIDRIVEDTDFAPETGATYTVTKALKTLPEGYTIVSMEELGDKILIGTSKAGNALEATIFVWDPTKTTWEGILKLKDEAIVNMITIDNLIYIQCGGKGRWYISNGVSIELFAQLPNTLMDLSSVQLDIGFTRNAICYMNGLIYFGVSYNSGSLEGLGIWSLNLQTKAINFEYTLSHGEYGQTANKAVYIGALIPLGGAAPNLLASWYDESGTAYGVDDIGTAKYTSDLAFLISQFFRVGYLLEKRSLNKFEVQLSKPMASGDSVKIYTRTAQNGTWKNLVDDADESATAAINKSFMSYAVEGAVQSHRLERVIERENIQFKVVLNDAAEFFELSAI